MEPYLFYALLMGLIVLILSYLFGSWTGSHRMLPPSLMKMWNIFFWIIAAMIFLLSIILGISTDEKTNWEVNFWLKMLIVFSITGILSIIVYTAGKKIMKARIRAKQRLYNM